MLKSIHFFLLLLEEILVHKIIIINMLYVNAANHYMNVAT